MYLVVICRSSRIDVFVVHTCKLLKNLSLDSADAFKLVIKQRGFG